MLNEQTFGGIIIVVQGAMMEIGCMVLNAAVNA